MCAELSAHKPLFKLAELKRVGADDVCAVHIAEEMYLPAYNGEAEAALKTSDVKERLLQMIVGRSLRVFAADISLEYSGTPGWRGCERAALKTRDNSKHQAGRLMDGSFRGGSGMIL